MPLLPVCVCVCVRARARARALACVNASEVEMRTLYMNTIYPYYFSIPPTPPLLLPPSQIMTF